MKPLIVYYSRTGLTKKIAEFLAQELHADLDRIIDKKDRKGATGYLIAGKDATLKKLTDIKFVYNPATYDTIIICGPVWSWTITPAVRTYLELHKESIEEKSFAFVATQGGSGAEKKFKVMQEILEASPIATLIINGEDFRKNKVEEKVDAFIQLISR